MKSLCLKMLVFATFALLPTLAHAGTEHNLIGWAWSDTIGWLSFNSTNDHDPNTAGIQQSSYNYGVHMSSGGNLCGNETCSQSGYAWSPNIGWVQFGGLSSFPSGSGTQGTNARVSGNNLQGWAKAITADGNGWDGWISLSGAGPSYGVNYSGTAFTGYAWGGDVVGWLSFDAAGSNGVSISSDVLFDVKTGGQFGSTISGQTIPYNSVPTFTWTMVNAPSASCAITKTSSGGSTLNPPTGSLTGLTTSGYFTAASGLQHTPTSSEWPYSYRMQCTNPTVDKTVSFTVDNETAAFTLGAADTARIQFLVSGSSDSELKTVTVNSFGGYSNPVTVSISAYPTPPADTTFLYSLGGGAFSATPSSVVVSPGNSTTFQVRISKAISTQYTVTLRGQGSGSPDQYKNIIINPTTYDPNISEF